MEKGRSAYHYRVIFSCFFPFRKCVLSAKGRGEKEWENFLRSGIRERTEASSAVSPGLLARNGHAEESLAAKFLMGGRGGCVTSAL